MGSRRLRLQSTSNRRPDFCTQFRRDPGIILESLRYCILGGLANGLTQDAALLAALTGIPAPCYRHLFALLRADCTDERNRKYAFARALGQNS